MGTGVSANRSGKMLDGDTVNILTRADGVVMDRVVSSSDPPEITAFFL